MSIAALVLLLAAAFYTTTRYPPAQLNADVTATELRFRYHPIEEGRTGGPEVPLLAGEPLADFSVRSFERLTAPAGTLSVRPDENAPWEEIQTSGPIVITSVRGSPAKADFKDVAIKDWQFEGDPDVALRIADVNAEPAVRAVVESPHIELHFGGGQSVEFECQLCRIEGRNEAVPAVRQVRIANLDYAALTASSSQTMVLDVTPGRRGFGKQRFRMSRPWLCGGAGVSPESSVVKGTVKFPDAGTSHALTGEVSGSSSVLRLTDDDEFSVIDLRAVREKKGSAPDLTSALAFVFEGRAKRAEVSAACNAAGRSIQPSLYKALENSRIVVVTTTAFFVFFGWLGFFDKLRGLWDRVRKADAKK
jgi:hypothetical protein